MRVKYLKAAALLALMPLTACALLPEEEALRTAPLIEPYVEEQFDSAVVERGDLILTETISCRYVPVQTAKLSFSMGGEYIDRLFVQAGDKVKKGQLLGQLRMNELESQIEEARDVIEELSLQSEHVRDLHELALRRLDIQGRTMSDEELTRAGDELQKEYNAEQRRIEAELSLQELTLKTLEKEQDERCIFAPFDGTITSVSKLEDGEMSVFGAPVITLVDSAMSLFRAETEYWDRFLPGDEHEMIVNKKSFSTVVTDEAELGLEPTEREPGKYGVVYFALTEPDFELQEGDRGRVTIVLDQRLNVLHIDADAVSSANGQPIVYYQREDGMKAYKPVETGMTVDGRTEIISGLDEGEIIIAG